MAVLTGPQRGKLPLNDFGMPAKRAYPVTDRAHAVAAKARATQQYERGNLSSQARTAINAKANAVLGAK